MSSPLGHIEQLGRVLDDCVSVTVACSGGIDSLVLATVAHRHAPERTIVAHTITPAVPGEATGRVVAHAERNGWNLKLVRSREFEDERYLSNPTDRCYYCKSNLYSAIEEVCSGQDAGDRSVVVSGANVDDLGEYRPGLVAASEHRVRHPYVETEITKADIRRMARHLGMQEAELPASPCLASRLYTGTRVTPERLRAAEAGELVLREAGLVIARCRRRDDDVFIEVPETHRDLLSEPLLAAVESVMTSIDPAIRSVEVDDRPYRAGQAILHVS